tara:strand:- start:8856 stop:9140 length:285 start_codon:yes stop_codon:yes gene_type:complete
MNELGQELRKVREAKNILLRQVSSFLEVDTALMSKIERGERNLHRDQVIKLSEYYNVSQSKLITLWLSDKVLNTLVNEPLAIYGIKNALKKIKK